MPGQVAREQRHELDLRVTHHLAFEAAGERRDARRLDRLAVRAAEPLEPVPRPAEGDANPLGRLITLQARRVHGLVEPDQTSKLAAPDGTISGSPDATAAAASRAARSSPRTSLVPLATRMATCRRRTS